MLWLNFGYVTVISFVFYWTTCDGLVLKGEWHSKRNTLNFLAKFGFQKTIPLEGASSEGFIFGNITTINRLDGKNTGGKATLVLLPRQFFFNFYGNRSHGSDDPATNDEICQRMFKAVMTEAYDAGCHDTGREDFLRHVPCPWGALCPDEDNAANVLGRSQLTYAIKDINNARFWYLSLVACHLNDTCGWQSSGPDISVTYHLTLVNGRPPATDHSFFAYHFSCDKQGVGELVLFCLLVYSCLLLPVQVWGACRQRLRVLEVFTAVLALQTLGLLVFATAQLVLGGTGVWLGWMAAAGELCTVGCEALFLLLLLLLARGWAVSKTTGHHTVVLYAAWGSYTALTLVLYCWNKVMVSAAADQFQYGTWPGALSLLLRGLLAVWFLLELRCTMLNQHLHSTLHFLLQLGAASLVWLVYLPVVAIIAVQVSPLWRHKLLLGFRYSADLLAHTFMAYILYPRRSHPYLVMATPEDNCDELDVLDQAPHVLHRRQRGIRSWGRRDVFRNTGYVPDLSSEVDGDEMVEFERASEALVDVNSNDNTNINSTSELSKSDIERNRFNGFSSSQNYRPLNNNILDTSDSDSYVQVDHRNGITLSSVPSSIARRNQRTVLDQSRLNNGDPSKQIHNECPVRLIELDQSSSIPPTANTGNRTDPTINTNIRNHDWFATANDDDVARAELFSGENSDASETELLVVVKDEKADVGDNL